MAYQDFEQAFMDSVSTAYFPTPEPVEVAAAPGATMTDAAPASAGSMSAIPQSRFEKFLEQTGLTLEQVGMELDKLGKVNIGGIEIGVRDLLPFVGSSEKRTDPLTGKEEVVQVGTPQALQKAGRGESLIRGTGMATQLVPDAKLALFDIPALGAAVKPLAKTAKRLSKVADAGKVDDIVKPNATLSAQEPTAAAQAGSDSLPVGQRIASEQSSPAIDRAGPVEAVHFVQLPDGKFATSTALEEAKQVKIGFDRASGPAEAAHITAGLRKSPQEQLVALVLDENDKPIQIIRHTIGLASQTSAEPFSLLGAIANTPGAKSFWLSHNHPSGKADLSTADKNLANAISRMSNDTGIEMRGILAIAKSKFSAYSPSGKIDVADGDIPAAARKNSISMVERTFRKSQLLDSTNVMGPKDAIKMAKKIAGDESGLVLFNNARQPVAFIPMNNVDLENLRDTGVAKQLFGALEKANAKATMYVTKLEPNMDGIANLEAMLRQVDSPMFDAIGGPNRESLVNQLPVKLKDFNSVFPAAALGSGSAATQNQEQK